MTLAELRGRLSYKVAVAASALTLFFVLLMGGGAFVVMQSLIRGQVRSVLENEAALRAEKVADVLQGIVAGAHALAENTVVANALVDNLGRETYVAPLLANFAEVNGVPVSLVVTDYRGRALVASREAAGGEPDAWVAEVVAAGRPAARLSGEGEEHRLRIAEPVVYANTGTAEGALTYTIRLADLAARVGTTAAAPMGSVLAFRHGDHVHEVALGGAGRAPSPMVAEVPVRVPPTLAAFAFTVRVAAEPSMLAVPLDRLTRYFLAIGLGTVLVVLAVSVPLGRRLTGQLSQLAAAATSYEFGEGDRRAFMIEGTDEIARLGQVFAGMVERLDRAYQDLERRSQTLLSNAERVAHVGSSVWDLTADRHAWSEEFHGILGLDPGGCAPSLEAFLGRVHPLDRPRVRRALDAAARDGRPVVEDFRIIRPDGEVRVLHGQGVVATDDAGRPVRLDGTIQDITERKRMEGRLEVLVRELSRSNEELEQFAYVASHDLRQPLRVVGSYVTLLEEELEGRLEGEQKEFIAFAREGVKRMDRLITDLLTYSRVGRTAKDRAVDMAEAVRGAVADLQIEIEEASAEVEVPEGLPKVLGDDTEMARLFQNLIGNAIKYRSPERPPVVRLACRDLGREWRFSVSDNGIGVPPEHAERVFGIFQRLHARDEYEGTGIGLAICRKIVERHGGRIWLDPASGEGTTVAFTWPKLRPAEAVA